MVSPLLPLVLLIVDLLISVRKAFAYAMPFFILKFCIKLFACENALTLTYKLITLINKPETRDSELQGSATIALKLHTISGSLCIF